jgi:hypothetical protein
LRGIFTPAAQIFGFLIGPLAKKLRKSFNKQVYKLVILASMRVDIFRSQGFFRRSVRNIVAGAGSTGWTRRRFTVGDRLAAALGYRRSFHRRRQKSETCWFVV